MEVVWVARSTLTLASLVLVSFAVLLYPIDRLTMLRIVGSGQQVRWVDAGERIALRVLLVAFVLSFYARPRLILPIALACVGTGLFWVFSNVP